MFCKSLVAVATLAAIAGTIALAQPTKDSKPAAQPAAKPSAAQPSGQPELPPGMTMEDMQACIEAGTPGEEHAWLAEGVGTWKGTCTMWMAPDTEPTVSDVSCVIETMMDGRYTTMKTSGEIPGMGPFNGYGINGFDNVSQKFVSTWVDSMSTGIMNGTGARSSDGATMTWSYTYNCPINKKPTNFRQVEKRTGKDSIKIEMFGAHPHTGVEFKMMELACTRTAR
jgi:hypothetical protein